MSYEPNHKDSDKNSGKDADDKFDDKFDDSDLVRGRANGATEEEEVQNIEDEDILDEEDAADDGDLDFEPDDSNY